MRISDWSSDVCSSELDRTGYPEGFPALPEVPTARYTEKRMYDLEMEHLWRKTWLHACHISEIPNDGTYKLFEQVGLNVIVTSGPGDQVRAFHNTGRTRTDGV